VPLSPVIITTASVSAAFHANWIKSAIFFDRWTMAANGL
jgi:hypothetical protein